jgi:uridine kinase
MQHIRDYFGQMQNNFILITIDGRAGSGKSALAMYLGELYDAVIFSSDDFSGWDYGFTWHQKCIDTIFTPLLRGDTHVTYQPVTWWPDQHPDLKHITLGAQIIILEGTGSNNPQLDSVRAISIFVDTPAEICIARGIARDTAAGLEPTLVHHRWHEWQEKETAYFAHYGTKATITITGTAPFAAQLQ